MLRHRILLPLIQALGDCVGELPTECVVYCETNDRECKNYTSGALVEENSTLTVIASSEDLPVDCKWKVTVETRNNIGRMNSTGNITMSKVDVVLSAVMYQM